MSTPSCLDLNRGEHGSIRSLEFELRILDLLKDLRLVGDRNEKFFFSVALRVLLSKLNHAPNIDVSISNVIL